MAKAIIVPFAWLAILIWAMVKAPPRVSLEPKHATISGSDLSWAWLSALNSALGIYATLAVNIPDFTVRYITMALFTLFSNRMPSVMPKMNERKTYSKESL